MLNEILWPAVTLGGLGLVLGLGLAIASKVFAIKTDPNIEKVRDLLPGANCGGCGYPGCDGFAKAVVAGEAAPAKCIVASEESLCSIGEILGVEATAGEKKVARVVCKGDSENCLPRYNYKGISDCRAAAAVAGGPSSCRYGCVGLMTCAKACPFDAIYLNEKGIAEVDEEKCTGCANCVAVCPKNSIAIMPKDKKVFISCHSPEKGKAVTVACKTGCIACGICAKKCPEGAITMVDNLPVIDYDKCTSCGICVATCPKKVIEGPSAAKEEAVSE